MMKHGIPERVEGASLAIETRELRKAYGRRVALDRADLTVPEGAAYVLVGPNGAGKTTTMQILLDLVRADAGSAELLGLDSVKEGAGVRALCGFLPERQEAGYAWMSVQDLLAHHASYRPSWDPDYARELMERLEVRDHTRFGKLSKGEARRVQLVMTLAHRPPVLLLDEPTDGLDPVMREKVLGLLGEHMARNSTTLVISTHLVYEVEGLGDHLGVLKDGVLRAQMSRDTLWSNLRRYSIEVPAARVERSELRARIVRRKDRGREAAWTIWGAEDEVTAQLRAAGARVRDVQPLTLEEAAVALLTMDTVDESNTFRSDRASVAAVGGR